MKYAKECLCSAKSIRFIDIMEEKEIRDLSLSVLDAFRAEKKTFATAESCTGGYIAKAVTDNAGASEVFLGCIVSYANSVKEKLLSVSSETLSRYGAVSAQTAEEMARGAVSALGCDFAVAVTGIAGPSGGSADKPVGLVYIAVAGKNIPAVAKRHIFDGARDDVRKSTVKSALSMLISTLEKSGAAR